MVVGGLWCGYILQDQLFNYESVWWLKLPQTGSWNTRQGKNSDISFRCLLIRKEEDWSWVKMKMNETWFCWTWFKRHTLLLLCFLISNRCGVISLFKINAGQIFFTDTATQRESGWAQTSFFSCCCRDCFLYLLLWRSVAWPHEGAAGFLLICIQLELHHKSLRSSRTSTRSSFRWRKLRSAIRVQVLHHCKSCCHPLFSKCEGAALHSSSTSAKVPSETKQKNNICTQSFPQGRVGWISRTRCFFRMLHSACLFFSECPYSKKKKTFAGWTQENYAKDFI